MDRREIVVNFKDYLCPVCLTLPIPPIYQCHNGHFYCKACHPHLTTCPVCRIRICAGGSIRALAVEQIVEKLRPELKVDVQFIIVLAVANSMNKPFLTKVLLAKAIERKLTVNVPVPADRSYSSIPMGYMPFHSACAKGFLDIVQAG